MNGILNQHKLDKIRYRNHKSVKIRCCTINTKFEISIPQPTSKLKNKFILNEIEDIILY